MISKVIKLRDGNTEWYNASTRAATTEMRRAEKKYKRLKIEQTLHVFRNKRQIKCEAMESAKAEYYSEKICQYEGDPRKLQEHMNKLMGKRSANEPLPQTSNDGILAEDFKSFFIGNVDRLNKSFTGVSETDTSLQPHLPLSKFESFEKVSKN